MKVTTELKSLIKRSFEEKRQAVEKEFKDMAEAKYREKIEWLESLPEYQQFINAQEALRSKLDSIEDLDFSVVHRPYYRGMSNPYLEIDSKKIIVNNAYNYLKNNKEVKEQRENRIKEIDMAQESLLIKLTYEKDLEKIKEMLNEYGINLI